MSTRPMFEQGIAELQKANYAAAEIDFKRAIRPDVDSTSALAYLAASFAAAGRDGEAAGAWQTALIDGSDVPQIYEWLAETLMRERDYTRRAIDSRGSGGEVAVGHPVRPDARAVVRHARQRPRRDSRARPLHRRRPPRSRPAVPDGRMALPGAQQPRRGASTAPPISRWRATTPPNTRRPDGPKQALVQQWVDFLANEKP